MEVEAEVQKIVFKAKLPAGPIYTPAAHMAGEGTGGGAGLLHFPGSLVAIHKQRGLCRQFGSFLR